MKTKKLGPFDFKIDRPKGFVKEWPGGKSFTYPCDYGYWPKLLGEDGEGLDAFVGDDEDGHLESFAKLNPDGTLDETKFLIGVSDADREKIYKLYGTEVSDRKVYESFGDVQRALNEFPAKKHTKTASVLGGAALGGLAGTALGYTLPVLGLGMSVGLGGSGDVSKALGLAHVMKLPHTLGTLGAGYGAYLAHQREQENKLAFEFGEKLASVPSNVKQYRRALQLLNNPEYDFHGTRGMSAIANLGEVQRGPRDEFRTGGVYMSRGNPDMNYWENSSAHPDGLPVDGGFIFPASETARQGGRLIEETKGYKIPYSSAPTMPLGKGQYVVPAGPHAEPIVDVIQRNHHLRPISAEAFDAARKTHRGELPVEQAQYLLSGKTPPSITPSPSVATTSQLSLPDWATPRNAAIAGGALAATGALAYGGYKAYQHFTRPKEDELHGVNEKTALVFDTLNWVPSPYQRTIQTPYQTTQSARSTPALAGTQANLRVLQLAQEQNGTPQYQYPYGR